MTHALLEMPDLEGRPLILLQMAILSLAYDEQISNLQIIARAFSIVAHVFNKYVGRPPARPHGDLGLIENLLYMIGKDHTDEILVKNFTCIMIAWMEMGLAPSAIATRINASSRSDIISALVAGVGNTAGEKHTSARIKSMRLLEDLARTLRSLDLSPAKNKKFAKKVIAKQLQDRLDNQEVIPGFGHYIFRHLDDQGIDPRIFLVERAINELYPENGMLPIIDIMREIFQEGGLVKNGKALFLPANSDIYWSAFLYSFFKDYSSARNLDAVASLFNILTRMSGLLAHYDEQKQTNDTMKVWGWITN